MIGGGGAAGLNGVTVARRLRCRTVVFPDAGAALSAAGAMMSELRAEAAHTEFMRTTHFDCDRANRILARLKQEAQSGSAASPTDLGTSKIDFAIEGRYPSQVWEIEVPLRGGSFVGENDVHQLVKDFHARHLELFGFADDGDEIEIVAWRAVCRTQVADYGDVGRVETLPRATALRRRSMTFRETGRVEAVSYDLESLRPGEPLLGPAIVESSFTTIVVHPGARAERKANGAFVVNVRPSPDR
jgi:N-methylhydantoinase A